MKKKIKKRKNLKRRIDFILLGIFFILTLLLIINVIKLSDIENLLRFIIIVGLIFIYSLFVIFRKRLNMVGSILIVILSLGFGYLNYAFDNIYSSLDNLTVTVNNTTIYLVGNEDYNKINDIKSSDKIAILSEDSDPETYSFAKEILSDKKLKSELVEYDDYISIIDALINQEIKFAFLPENYEDIYNVEREEKVELHLNLIYKDTKTTKVEEVHYDLSEPFTILLIGVDNLENSYNADTLMLVTFNPKTLKVTMLSIPRDTYTNINGTSTRHKINASGWNGDKSVVRTVENYMDIDINYYVKINFTGIVDLVDKLGGVEVDVPYAFCEQDSLRRFGEHMIYVDSGLQTLNGEQALALTRNRHYWKDICPAKYTSDGERSDLVRGENQQVVIKAIINKMMGIRDLEQFYSILDTASSNMSTNMSRETILSFYNVLKDIIKKLNASTADDIFNIERLTLNNYFATVSIGGLDLSILINYNESIEYNSKVMKKNLGLIQEDMIKTVSFDINEDYEKESVKFSKLTSNYEFLPNFVGKTLSEAVSYCNRKGLNCDTGNGDLTETIISQSIAPNSDIALLKTKVITFEVESRGVVEEKEEIVDKEPNKDSKVDDNKEENNISTPNDKEENVIDKEDEESPKKEETEIKEPENQEIDDKKEEKDEEV